MWNPPPRSVLFLAKVWIIYSMLPQCLPSETMQKKLRSDMVPQGAQGYSAERTKPSVPPMRVFVRPSKPGQTNVWVGDSSSSLPNVSHGAVSEAAVPTNSTSYSLQKNIIISDWRWLMSLNSLLSSSFIEKEVWLLLGRWSLRFCFAK